jgi:hypothetical protein
MVEGFSFSFPFASSFPTLLFFQQLLCMPFMTLLASLPATLPQATQTVKLRASRNKVRGSASHAGSDSP